jgi:hypothetical protein
VKPPIDLKAEYGARYRIQADPAAVITPQSEDDRAWLHQIPCRVGRKGAHIYSHGFKGEGAELGYFAAKTARRQDGTLLPLAAALMKIPGAVLLCECDQEFTACFPMDSFEALAAIVKPKTRRTRVLTDEQRATLKQRLEPYLFKPGRPALKWQK